MYALTEILQVNLLVIFISLPLFAARSQLPDLDWNLTFVRAWHKIRGYLNKQDRPCENLLSQTT